MLCYHGGLAAAKRQQFVDDQYAANVSLWKFVDAHFAGVLGMKDVDVFRPKMGLFIVTELVWILRRRLLAFEASNGY